MKLWDVRKCCGLLHHPTTGQPGFDAALLHTFTEHREGVGGLAALDKTAISFSAAQVSLASLHAPYEASVSSLMLNDAEGTRDLNSIVALAILPVGRLMLFADSTGNIKVCR